MKFLVTAELAPSFHAWASQSTCILLWDDATISQGGLFTLSSGAGTAADVDVWICNGEEVTGDLMNQWLGLGLRQACYDTPKSMLVQDASTIPQLMEYAKGRVAEIAGFPQKMPPGGPGDMAMREWEESILREAEMLYSRARARVHANTVTKRVDVGAREKNKEDGAGASTVLLVGAGIVNLMTAHFLARHGYRVQVVDQGPDPRSCQQQDCTRLGATSGGHNARMFTSTEADNYNDQGSSEVYNHYHHHHHNHQSKCTSSMQHSVLRKTICNGGWNVKSPKDFTAAEHSWVNAFEHVPAWMAAIFKNNMYQVNCESGKIWKELMETEPQLFEGVGFHKDIVRMYVEPVDLDISVKRNRSLGSLLEAPSLSEFLRAYPGFCHAAESGNLAGAITVDGFTVNIHLLVAKLIDHISSLGGEFVWNCQVHGILRNTRGEVTALKSQKGCLEADYFVVSAGVPANGLLNGTACENMIHGVLGIWLQIPNLDMKIRNSMKICRRGHKVEDINITVAKDQETGEDILIFGGGYGYIGLNSPPPDSPEVKALYDELEEVARVYFPRGYASAKKRGPTAMYPGGGGSGGGGRRQFCVRPFTPTGLGVFERLPTASGGQLIITGGNNTGGFAQAPGIARAVSRSFMGEYDPIHVLFHPDRGKLVSSSVTYKSRAPSPEAPPSPPSPLLLLPEHMDSVDTKPRRQQPLKLLLLCSDGPQHRYLRYRLDQAFPGYHCVQETDQGQIRHLMDKGWVIDAYWQKYHGLRREFFSYGRQRRAYFDRLVPQDYRLAEPDLIVDSVNCREVWDAVDQWQPEVTIVSGTKYIGKKLIARGGLMINLHTGHLPEYKGNHCIFFALYDGEVDKVASTLHQLTPNLDGGDVLDRVYPPILPMDNEETLYTRCLEMSIDKCVYHIGRFSRGEVLEFVPQEGEGRTFRHRDRTPAKELWLWWILSMGGLLRSTTAPVEEIGVTQFEDRNL